MCFGPLGASLVSRRSCAKYVARREKDCVFTKELAIRGITNQQQLLMLLDSTPVEEDARERIRAYIARDFEK